MANEWKEYSVEEFAEVIGGGTPSTNEEKNFGGNIPWITPKDLSTHGFRYIVRGERNITKLGLNASNATLLPTGAVLLSSRAPVGYLAIASNSVTTNQGFKSLIVRDGFDNEFVYYLLKSNVEYLKSHSSGTTFGELSGGTLKRLKFSIPPFPEQHAIAGILGALDDKIEVNRRMNATLESMARAVFRQWFVENEEVINWEEKSLDEIASFLNGLALQKFPPQGNKFLPVIKIAQLRKNDTEGADKASTNIPPQYIIEDGDILFSWSGSLVVVAWCGGKGALNQHLFKVTSEKYPKWFYYFWTKHHLPEFQEIAAGKATTMGHIQRHHLSAAKVLVPDDDRLQEMDKFISPLLDKIITNNLESRTLARIRDSLLPKLMKGEARVK